MTLVSRPRPQLTLRKKANLLFLPVWSRLLCLFGICLLPLLLLAACGSGTNAAGPTVSALDNSFSPKVLHVKVGQTVTWINNGQSPHTVTADNKSFDSGIFQSGAK